MKKMEIRDRLLVIMMAMALLLHLRLQQRIMM